MTVILKIHLVHVLQENIFITFYNLFTQSSDFCLTQTSLLTSLPSSPKPTRTLVSSTSFDFKGQHQVSCLNKLWECLLVAEQQQVSKTEMLPRREKGTRVPAHPEAASGERLEATSRSPTLSPLRTVSKGSSLFWGEVWSWLIYSCFCEVVYFKRHM